MDQDTITVSKARNGKIAPHAPYDARLCQECGLWSSWPSFEAAQKAIERAGYTFAKFDPAAVLDLPAPLAAKMAPLRKAPKAKSAKPTGKDIHATREAWLLEAIELFRPWFTEAGTKLPEKVRASCGWALGTRKAIGQAFPSGSRDGQMAVFVSPVLGDASRVLDVLLHELCHVALPPKTGHKAPFAKLAAALGMVKPWTATTASPGLVERLKPFVAKLGTYPHSVLDVSKQKKQGTRLLKAACGTCGYTVRVTSKWMEIGPPRCAIASHGPMICESFDEKDD